MQDFFKYLTPGEADKNWGLYLSVAGRATILPEIAYPSRKHPTGYFFTWNKGRVLQEYQLVYITKGAGLLEDKQGKVNIKEGTTMLIRPGEYHRYRPILKIGWVENYIGFNGNIIPYFFEQAGFLNSQSHFDCGVRDFFLEIYYEIFKLVQEERPGFQQIASGLILKLLGSMVAYHKQGDFSGKNIENIIQKARMQMRTNVEKNIDLQQLAKQYHISYANFRKMFKKYTGMSPRQYHLELKVMRAKELILTSDKNIKEISDELNFDSIHYFSRYFKQKTGYSPTKLRKTIN